MLPDDLSDELTVTERDQVHHAVTNAAAVIQGYAQLMQRRVVRLDGLSQLERDLLSIVTDIVAATRRPADDMQTPQRHPLPHLAPR